MNENTLRAAGPQGVLPRLFKRVPRYIVITFAATFILCILVHHEAYTSGLLNRDNLGHMFGSNYGVMSGRWLLPKVLAIDGNISIPWTIGMITAAFLSLSACIVVCVCRIRSSVGCVAAAAIMVTFPTIASNNFYIFSADAYMLSLFLACLGAYLTVKFRFGFIPGCAALTLSAGIYQAFLSVGAALLVGALIFELLDGEKSVWEIVKKGVKYLFALAVGIAAYYVIVKFTSQSTGLVDYKGISSMGVESIKELRWTVVAALTYYFKFFIKDYLNFHSVLATAAFYLMLVSIVIMSSSVIRRRSLGWLKSAMLIVLFIFFLLAGNLTILVAPLAEMHLLMIYGMCLLPVVAVAIGDYVYAMKEISEAKDSAAIKLDTVCVWLVTCAAVILSANYAIRDNEAYLKSEIVEKEAVSYGNRMLCAVQQTEGYKAGMPIVLVGTRGIEPLKTPGTENITMTGCFEMDSIISSYTYNKFLRYYCGWVDEIYTEGDMNGVKIVAQYSAMDEVKEMPVYPNQGSVEVIDGAVVVKLS